MSTHERAFMVRAYLARVLLMPADTALRAYVWLAGRLQAYEVAAYGTRIMTHHIICWSRPTRVTLTDASSLASRVLLAAWSIALGSDALPDSCAVTTTSSAWPQLHDVCLFDGTRVASRSVPKDGDVLVAAVRVPGTYLATLNESIDATAAVDAYSKSLTTDVGVSVRELVMLAVGPARLLDADDVLASLLRPGGSAELLLVVVNLDDMTEFVFRDDDQVVLPS
jgi:hypothetical protein